MIAKALGIELCVVHSVEAAEIVNRGGSPRVHVLFRELVQADGTAKVVKAKAKVVEKLRNTLQHSALLAWCC